MKKQNVIDEAFDDIRSIIGDHAYAIEEDGSVDYLLDDDGEAKLLEQIKKVIAIKLSVHEGDRRSISDMILNTEAVTPRAALEITDRILRRLELAVNEGYGRPLEVSEEFVARHAEAFTGGLLSATRVILNVLRQVSVSVRGHREDPTRSPYVGLGDREEGR